MKSFNLNSFYLGMVFAFSECVANESKKLGLSSPFSHDEYAALKNDVEKIITDQGLKYYWEYNKDMDCDNPPIWALIYKFDSVLDEYLVLRKQGYNCFDNFEKFHKVLSYGTCFSNPELITKILIPPVIKNPIDWLE